MLVRSVVTFLSLFCLQAAVAADLKGWVLEDSQYPTYQGLAGFFSALNQRSGGRFAGKIGGRDDVGNQKKVVPMLQKGELDVAVLTVAPLADALPVLEVLQLPFLFTDSDHMLKVLDGNIGKELEAKLAAKGYVVLTWYDGGSRSFYSRGKPLRWISDFRDKNIRVANRAVMKSMVGALDAKPSTQDFDEVAGLLSGGQLDAAENDLISYETTGHYKIAPYYTFSNHTILPLALVVSSQRWQSLSDSDRTLFRAVARDSAIAEHKLQGQREDAVRVKLEKEGVKFFKLDSANVIARMKSTYAPVLKSPDATDLAVQIMAFRK
ncbi:MAG: TRAP transporter substrate-binding protein DctP [Rhodocyclaceae bacterium]